MAAAVKKSLRTDFAALGFAVIPNVISEAAIETLYRSTVAVLGIFDPDAVRFSDSPDGWRIARIPCGNACRPTHER
jgi:hypothetical protein